MLHEKNYMHNNTKYWAFTWGTNVSEKQIPPEVTLKRFLNMRLNFFFNF